MSLQVHCPRCNSALIKSDANHQNIKYVCPNGDGVLVPLPSLQHQTNRSFVQAFWKYWRGLVHAKSFPCPLCHYKMETVGEHQDAKLILDCCPHCYALWLDAGEDKELQNFFKDKFIPLESDHSKTNLENQKVQAMAAFVLEHEKTIAKYERLFKFGRLLSASVRLGSRLRGYF